MALAPAFNIRDDGLSAWSIGQGVEKADLGDASSPVATLVSLSNEMLFMICEHINDPATLIIIGSTCQRLYHFTNSWGGIWQSFLPLQTTKAYNPKANYRAQVLAVMNGTSRTGCQLCLRPMTKKLYQSLRLRLCEDCLFGNTIRASYTFMRGCC